MSGITLRVLDGADRGRIFEKMQAPITIGREEGNSIQLNDERVSRYHIKIQEDNAKLVLTDLESTNGTKVNGEDIQLRILRFGDMITLGRSVLLFGSREEIASRLAKLRGDKASSGSSVKLGEARGGSRGAANWADESNVPDALHMLESPDLPERLSPAQAAQLAEVIEYVHVRVRHLLSTIQSDPKSDRVSLDAVQWQSLLDLQARLAEYLRAIGEPTDRAV